MGCLRVKIDKVPEVVVRSLSLRDFVVWLRFDSMHYSSCQLHINQIYASKHTKVGELDRILDEEDRDIVSNNVPISLVSVELDSEASHVSHGVRATSATLHR